MTVWIWDRNKLDGRYIRDLSCMRVLEMLNEYSKKENFSEWYINDDGYVCIILERRAD